MAKNTTWRTTIESMTTAERDAATDGEYAIIFNTDLNRYQAYNDSTEDWDSINEAPLDIVTGYGFYTDSLATPTITVGTSPVLLTIDALGANSNSSQLPLEIRGSSELWTPLSTFTPILDGDGYDIRLDFTIDAKVGNPNYMTVDLDIGGGATPSIVIMSKRVELGSSTPYNVSFGTPIFTGATFKANGGQVFITTDTGTVDISARQVLIKRDHRAN